VFWIDEAGGLMNQSARPKTRCESAPCAELSEARSIAGLPELTRIAAPPIDGGKLALAHISRLGELALSELELREGTWSLRSTTPLSPASSDSPAAIARTPSPAADPQRGGAVPHVPSWIVLFRAEDGALMQVLASAGQVTAVAPALDARGVPIVTARGPSLLTLGTGELCGVFPDPESHIRFYCYEPVRDVWSDLSGRAFYATLGPKTGSEVGMAYHRFRYADAGFVDERAASDRPGARGAVYLSFTEPAPDAKTPDTPHLLISRALDHDALARATIDFRWRGSLINQWAHVARGGAVALYEDASLPGLVAVMATRIKGDEAARIDLLPVADGTFDAVLTAGDDFEVMERGICTGLRGARVCGAASTAAY
jgi:hypothetical protein